MSTPSFTLEILHSFWLILPHCSPFPRTNAHHFSHSEWDPIAMKSHDYVCLSHPHSLPQSMQHPTAPTTWTAVIAPPGHPSEQIPLWLFAKCKFLCWVLKPLPNSSPFWSNSILFHSAMYCLFWSVSEVPEIIALSTHSFFISLHRCTK